jgi:diguanylate cyclase (GGDEF)-like protein/PAS domain S-box-containing protein
MTIDVTTISIVATIINFVLAAALTIQWRINRRHNGLGWWALSFAAGGLGFGFAFLRAIPPLVSIGIIGNNIFFVIEQLLLYIGVLRFFGQRERRAWILWFLFIFIVLGIYYTVVNNDIVIRRNIFNMTCAAFLFLASRATIQYKVRNVSVTANYLAAAFAFVCVVFILSTLFNSLLPSDSNPLIASLSQINSMVGGLVGTVMEAFGIILLVNQRLSADSQNANDNLELLFNTNPDAVLLTRLSGDSPAVRVNDGFTRLFGLSRAEVLSTSAFNTTIWKDPAVRQKMLSILEEKGECDNFEAVFRHSDGEEFFGLVSAKLFQMEGMPHIISVTRDITERKHAEQAIRQSEEKFSKAFQTSPYAITITRVCDGKFIEVNDAFSSITGISREEALADSTLGLNMWVNPEERAQVVASLRTGSPVSGLEFLFHRKNGEIMTGLFSAQLINLNGEDCALSSINDITERKLLEEELHLQATTDELTGVFNRRYFLRVAQQELHRAARLNHATSVAIIDLDHFKHINDTYGHSIGDQVLIAFSKICRDNIRDIDVFARFGGDEFVLFFVETELERACSVLERMRQMVSSQPILLEGRLVALSMTAGVAASLAGSDSLDGLISRADQLLYQAKQSGGNLIGVDQASGAVK